MALTHNIITLQPLWSPSEFHTFETLKYGSFQHIQNL